MSYRVQLLSVIGLFASLSLTGCGSSNSSGTVQLRLMNASPQQPNLNMLIDNSSFQSSIPYPSASAYASEAAGTHTVQLEAVDSTTALTTQSITLSSGADYTVLAVESTTASTALTMSLLNDNNTAPSSGNVEVRIINASPDFGNADVYISAPGVGTSSGTGPSVGNLAFPAASSYQTLVAGAYEIYFTVAGQQDIAVDSGPLSLTGGQIQTLVLVGDATTGYTSTLVSDLN